MIPYIGCEHARELVEGFIDGELALADQVALEAHLRWCRTCAAHVEDLQLIGASLRAGSPVPDAEDARALAAIQAGVLTRVRAEREESLPVRLRSMFDDMRFFWPALGATAALIACLFASLGVMQAATAENPESLAAMIERLDRPSPPAILPASPGSDQNPLRLDGRVSFPRALDAVSALDTMWDEEVAIAVSAIVTREGRIAAYDVLRADTDGPGRRTSQDEVTAVLDAVKRSRFAPAETAGGQKVAVNMVWLIVRTTARVPETRAAAEPPRPAADVVKPADVEQPADAPPTDPAEPAAVTTTA